MNESELLRRLGMRMSADSQPDAPVDVVSRVIGQISQTPRRTVDPWLSLISITACALAVVVLLVTRSAPADQGIFSPLAEAAANSTGPDALRRVLAP